MWHKKTGYFSLFCFVCEYFAVSAAISWQIKFCVCYPSKQTLDPQPAALWHSPCNVLRQRLTIFSIEYYQIIISSSSRREFSVLHVRNRTWRALHCQSLKHKLKESDLSLRLKECKLSKWRTAAGKLFHTTGVAKFCPRAWNRVVGAGRRAEPIACCRVYRTGQVVWVVLIATHFPTREGWNAELSWEFNSESVELCRFAGSRRTLMVTSISSQSRLMAVLFHGRYSRFTLYICHWFARKFVYILIVQQHIGGRCSVGPS